MSDAVPSPAAKAVVIGASAGAVEALMHILPELPKNYPLAVLIVIHLPPDSDSTLVSLLAGRCRINVKEAEDKETICPGIVYLAPPNYHLLVEPDFSVSLSSDEPVLYSRPSIDVLFESAADAYGTSLAGVVLTGGNSDGAQGLRKIDAAGGTAIVQEPGSAAFPEMPKAALNACPKARTVSLSELVTVLKDELPRILR